MSVKMMINIDVYSGDEEMSIGNMIGGAGLQEAMFLKPGGPDVI